MILAVFSYLSTFTHPSQPSYTTPTFNSMHGGIQLSGLRLIESNRLEVLSEVLASSLSDPLFSPLTPEIIVVQSRGIQRWLFLELARLYGVYANVSFPFPNAFVLEKFSRVLPGLIDQDAFGGRKCKVLPIDNFKKQSLVILSNAKTCHILFWKRGT